MNLARTKEAMRDLRETYRSGGATVGFVPTMGALHEGHLSLVRQSREECDRTVVSIFVNPAQFAPNEDYDQYPRVLEQDLKLLEELEVDAVFAPEAGEMYPDGFHTSVSQSVVTEHLCGASRPHFFSGVLTVVLKLFHVVEPTHAYFGRKDAQQAAVIRRMIRDLDLPVELRTVPIVREPDGLALSSRNRYLSPEERRDATALVRGLEAAEEAFAGGERDASRLEDRAKEILATAPTARVDYIEIVDPETMQPIERIEGRGLLALAVWVGETRLIDNRELGER